MTMKTYKPITPSRRQMTGIDFSVLTKKKPEKKLTVFLKKNKGRSRGQITVRHKGGGHKKKYRLIDNKRNKLGIPAKVVSIEYDPNRSAFISLLQYKDGEKRYILAPQDIGLGSEIISDWLAPLKIGNRMQLKNIPVGTEVHNIEIYPQGGGKLVKGAGTGARLLAFEGKYVNLQMPSGEIRMLPGTCMATVGRVSNPEYWSVVWGKAGRSRWRGIRPTVRGSAMNPVDHPHGGGEGRAGIGLRLGPKTPWGKQAYGVKTRKRKKWSDKFILKRRK